MLMTAAQTNARPSAARQSSASPGSSARIGSSWSGSGRSGRATAESWLRDHFDALGRRSTVDVEVTYL